MLLHIARFRSFFMLLSMVAVSLKMEGASLTPATVAAWNSYLDAESAKLQRRALPGSEFLWTFEDAKRAMRVRRGEIVVGKMANQDPLQINGGLIHHWGGAMFLPHVTLREVAEVTGEYARYKEFYRPTVIDSKIVSRDRLVDKVSMVMMNKALFLQAALAAEYDVETVSLDDHRLYRISRTTRVQEIKNFGSVEEQRIPEGEGSGYLWKLYSVARFQERDGGVYTELEFIALSRDVPPAMRFIADPIIRNVSKSSLVTSLQQTDQAIRGVIASNIRIEIPNGLHNTDAILEAHPASAFLPLH